MKSVMKHQFSQVPQATIQRSQFDRSHGLKTTFDAGYLVPIFVDEALPGDTFNLKMSGFARLATPIKPIMDNLYMETFFFAIPYRIVWDNWEEFNGEQKIAGQSNDRTIPQVPAPDITGYVQGSVGDYMGIPTGITGFSHSSLLFRAHLEIYNEWFRDQNITDYVGPYNHGDGPDNPFPYGPFRRNKRHDYFTSCLPWPQKGDAVDLPLGGTADVIGTQDKQPKFSVDDVSSTVLQALAGSGDLFANNAPTATGVLEWDQTKLVADLSTASAVTINQMREAFQLQKMLERDARGGTRYTEVIRSHFGVTSPDARLQRPEFLGGGHSSISVSPVAQTQASDEVATATPQANLAAIGTATLNGHGFTKSFTEHCMIIGYVNVRADLTYQQGLNRMWSRLTRYDYYWPTLAHLGEQSVLNSEIYLTGDPLQDDLVFGYQEMYAEYRYKPSLITGKFRSTDAESLDIWHLSQEFLTTPVLTEDFMQDDPPIDRIIAVQDEPHFLFDAYFSLKCARPMPLYGVPGNIDRF